MAAQAQATRIYQIPIDTIAAELRNPRLSQSLSFTFNGEFPVMGGACFKYHRGVSFTSWGENITVTLLMLQPGVTQVNVHSECSLPTQIIDWGHNDQNTNGIFQHIDRFVLPFMPLQQPQYQQQPDRHLSLMAFLLRIR